MIGTRSGDDRSTEIVDNVEVVAGYANGPRTRSRKTNERSVNGQRNFGTLKSTGDENRYEKMATEMMNAMEITLCLRLKKLKSNGKRLGRLESLNAHENRIGGVDVLWRGGRAVDGGERALDLLF